MSPESVVFPRVDRFHLHLSAAAIIDSTQTLQSSLSPGSIHSMDRLVIVEPAEVRLHLEDHIDGSSSGHTATVHLHSVLHTMPVAFKIQPLVAGKYAVKPALGMIPPLGSVNLEISLLSSSRFYSLDGFEVKSVVVAGAGRSKEWFSSQKRIVYTDTSLKVRIIGGVVLRDAIIRGALDEARQILEAGTNPDSWNPQGLTALHLAIQARRSAAAARLLLEFGARVDTRTMNAEGRTPLHCAAVVGSAEILEILLERSADPELPDSSGWRAIHHAVSGGESALAAMARVADVNAPIGDGRTALHLAVIAGGAGGVRILAENGVDVGARTVDGKTALHLAATQGNNAAIAKLLLAHGAQRTAVDWNGRTAYDEALELGQESLFALLYVPGKAGKPPPGNPASGGDDLEELLRNAAWKGDLRGLKRCLKRGAAVYSRDRFGWTPLHCAAFKGQAEIVRFLLETCRSKEEVGAIDEQGYSALHCAVESGHREVVKMLASCEMIDINAVTVEGLSALDMALALQHGGMVRTLVNAGARAAVANLIMDE